MGCSQAKSVVQDQVNNTESKVVSKPTKLTKIGSTTVALEKDLVDAPAVSGAAVEINYKAIHSAVRWSKPAVEIAKLLVSTEAANCVDPSNGNRPIHIAAQNGHTDIIALLISKSADVNVKNLKGNTPIHMAIGYDYYNAAMLLVNSGANPDVKNDAGIPANLGLEGDKSFALAALVSAKNAEEVDAAYDMCELKMDTVNKASFVQAGLKVKKLLADEWTTELQDRFKSIVGRLN